MIIYVYVYAYASGCKRWILHGQPGLQKDITNLDNFQQQKRNDQAAEIKVYMENHQHGAWYLVSDVWWSTRTKVQNSMETCNNMMYTTRFATWSWNRLKGVKKEWTQGSWQWTQRCYRQTAIDRDAEPVNITSVTKNGRSLVDGQVGARKNNNSIGMRDTICGSWWRVTSHTAVVFLVTHGKSIPPGRNHGNLPSMKHGGMITQSWVIGATVIQ